jgi:biopolymer transport protein ExbB
MLPAVRRRLGPAVVALAVILGVSAAPAAAQGTPAAAAAESTSPVDAAPSPAPVLPEASAHDATGVAAPSPALTVAPPVAEMVLPRDLSPIGMFLAADIVVQLVMIGLAVASVVSWTVWLAKTLELAGARRRARDGLKAVETAASLDDALARLPAETAVVRDLAAAAAAEIAASAGLGADGIKERIASRLERIDASAGRAIGRGTGVLATIGSTAPFVGLFGTVWGIMNSFIGISKAHTTNLAVVAPGIAEALLATALGLIAAIPAVMIYNVFARQIVAYRGLVGDAAAAVLRLAGRDLDRRGGQLRKLNPAAE